MSFNDKAVGVAIFYLYVYTHAQTSPIDLRELHAYHWPILANIFVVYLVLYLILLVLHVVVLSAVL